MAKITKTVYGYRDNHSWGEINSEELFEDSSAFILHLMEKYNDYDLTHLFKTSPLEFIYHEKDLEISYVIEEDEKWKNF